MKRVGVEWFPELLEIDDCLQSTESKAPAVQEVGPCKCVPSGTPYTALDRLCNDVDDVNDVGSVFGMGIGRVCFLLIPAGSIRPSTADDIGLQAILRGRPKGVIKGFTRLQDVRSRMPLHRGGLRSTV